MPRISEATKVEHRRRLLDAAAAEFAAKGLEAARVDDISLAAGLAKGTIYNYFDSKHDVFIAVVETWAARIDAARVATAVDAPIRAQLLAIVQADMAVTHEMEEFARTAFREVLHGPPELVRELLPAWDPVDAALARAVERGQRSGELRTDRSSEELTRLFITLVNGLLFEHWLPASEIALADIPELAVDFYLRGAAA